MKFERESYIVSYGAEIIFAGIGEIGEVEFDFESIWAWLKENKVDPCLLSYVHTHPAEFLGFSNRDVDCLRALSIAFGVTPLFYSVSFTGPVQITNTDHEGFILRKDGDEFVTFPSKIIPRPHLLALKAMSYAKSADK